MPTVTEVTNYHYCLCLPGQLNLGCWEGAVADAASPNSCPGNKREEQREELPVLSEQQLSNCQNN